MKWSSLPPMLLVAAVSYGADTPPPTPAPTVIDEIVAKVNGDIVTRNELEKSSRDLSQRVKEQGAPAAQMPQAVEQGKKNLLRERIDQLLLVQRGKELNINVDSDVSKYLAEIQRNQGISDPDKFHDLVRQQTGMPWEDFLGETKNNFLTRQVIGQEVSRRVSVSHQEIADYYAKHKEDFIREEKVFLQDILVSADFKNPQAAAAAEKKSKALVERATKGERFADLARDNSDAVTAKQGGELGGFKRGELMKDVEDKIWSLPKGGVAGPIRSQNGFMILKVEDHTKAGQAPLEDVEAEIQEKLYAPRMQPKIREYLTGLRKTAYLQIREGYDDTGAAPGKDTHWQDPAELKPETITKTELAEKKRHKRLFGVVPIPGTTTTVTGKSSSR